MTRRQQACLSFVRRTIEQTGLAPTIAEIGAGIGITGKGQVHNLIRMLVDAGFLVRTRERVRGLALPKVEPVDLASIPTSELHAELKRRLGRIVA